MGYQTFPWVKGDSNSYGKLRALNLPNLKKKSFLDVGCNEGFFCGFAKFCGAKKVVGIDKNPGFLTLAAALFPDCEFICQNWEDIGDEKYDIILNSSAIHYARDQKTLLDLLVSRLKPRGTLVLEIGVAPGDDNRFVEVKRSIDTRLFPTRKKLEEMLSGYAYKFISRSVEQAGDPVQREVYHISRKLPYAILALDDPHAGKSYTVKHIFKNNIKLISGDRLYYEIADDKHDAPEKIAEIIKQNISRRDLGHITGLLCTQGLFVDFCRWLARLQQHGDFILDMYVPVQFRERMARIFEMEDYYVVNINLQKAVSRPRALEKSPDNVCYDYLKYLQKEFVINEEEYLAANPDVAKALEDGKITGALAHYIFCGRREGRKRSLKERDE